MGSTDPLREAEQQLEQVLQRHDTQNHPEVFECLRKTGRFYNSCGNYCSALKLFEESIKMGCSLPQIEKLTLGEAYADAARCLIRHEKYSQATDRINSAKTMYETVQDQRSKELHMADTENLLGILARSQCQFEAGINHHMAAMNILLGLYADKRHEKVGQAYKELGKACHEQSNFKSAVQAYQQAYNILGKLEGQEKNIIKLLRRWASTLACQGEFDEANIKLDKANRLIDNRYNQADKAILKALVRGSQADVSLQLTSYKDARDKLNLALAAMKIFFSSEHPESQFFADLCIRQGDSFAKRLMIDEAVKHYEEAMSTVERMYSCKHSDYGRIVNKCALAYRYMGNYNKCLASHLTALGVFHEECQQKKSKVEVAETYSQLGELYCEIQNYDLAKKYNFQSLEMNKKIYGGNAHNLPIYCNYVNLASTLLGEKDTSQASQYLNDAMEILEKILDEDTTVPLLIRWSNLKGLVYVQEGNMKDAKSFFTEGLHLCELLYGDNQNHVDSGKCFGYLGAVALAEGNVDEAQIQYSLAYIHCKTFEESQEYRGLDSICFLIKFAEVSLALQNYDQVKAHFDKVEEDLNNLLGDQTCHDAVAMKLQLSADWHRKIGDNSKALELYEESLSVKESLYSESLNRLDLAELNKSLGKLYGYFGLRMDSLTYYQRSLAIFGKIYKGSCHMELAQALEAVGLAYDTLEQHKDALPYYKAALEIKEKITSDYRKIKPEIIKSYLLQGKHFATQNKFNDSFNCYELAEELSEGLDSSESVREDCLNEIGKTFGLLGQYHEAELILIRSIKESLTKYREMLEEKTRGLSLRSLVDRKTYLERLKHVENCHYHSLGQSCLYMADLYYTRALGIESISASERKQRNTLSQALFWYQHTLETLSKVLSNKDVLFACIYSKIGSIFRLQATFNISHAFENCDKALKCRKTAYENVNNSHPDLVMSILEMGKTLILVPNLEDATAHIKKARELIDASYGATSCVAIKYDALEALGDLELAKDNYSSALARYKEAYVFQTDKCKDKDILQVGLFRSIQNLIKAYKKLCHLAEVEKYEKILVGLASKHS
ncbi:tetratricopeptide repeat protein 28-like [Watersipora subatra]|uniref:tetratricopeptide repeat protein 28-like n=1 Tax=Watersipora subatra TaxID=2589382 RepID=UPI00355C875D